jgi:hypothetical protein
VTIAGDPMRLEAFIREVVSDPELVARLRPVLDRDAFIGAIIALARERGFEFDRTVIETAMREGQRVWLNHLPHD